MHCRILLQIDELGSLRIKYVLKRIRLNFNILIFILALFHLYIPHFAHFAMSFRNIHQLHFRSLSIYITQVLISQSAQRLDYRLTKTHLFMSSPVVDSKHALFIHINVINSSADFTCYFLFLIFILNRNAYDGWLLIHRCYWSIRNACLQFEDFIFNIFISNDLFIPYYLIPRQQSCILACASPKSTVMVMALKYLCPRCSPQFFSVASNLQISFPLLYSLSAIFRSGHDGQKFNLKTTFSSFFDARSSLCDDSTKIIFPFSISQDSTDSFSQVLPPKLYQASYLPIPSSIHSRQQSTAQYV